MAFVFLAHKLEIKVVKNSQHRKSVSVKVDVCQSELFQTMNDRMQKLSLRNVCSIKPW